MHQVPKPVCSFKLFLLSKTGLRYRIKIFVNLHFFLQHVSQKRIILKTKVLKLYSYLNVNDSIFSFFTFCESRLFTGVREKKTEWIIKTFSSVNSQMTFLCFSKSLMDINRLKMKLRISGSMDRKRKSNMIFSFP